LLQFGEKMMTVKILVLILKRTVSYSVFVCIKQTKISILLLTVVHLILSVYLSDGLFFILSEFEKNTRIKNLLTGNFFL